MWKLSAALVHPACTLRQEERRTMLTATGIERALRELPRDMEHFLLTTGCRSTPRETHVDSPRKALVSVVWTYVCVFFMFLFFVSLFVFGFFLLFLEHTAWWQKFLYTSSGGIQTRTTFSSFREKLQLRKIYGATWKKLWENSHTVPRTLCLAHQHGQLEVIRMGFLWCWKKMLANTTKRTTFVVHDMR